MRATIISGTKPGEITANIQKQVRYAATNALWGITEAMRAEAGKLVKEHFQSPVARTKEPAYKMVHGEGTGAGLKTQRNWRVKKGEVGLKNQLKGINPDKYLRTQIKGRNRRDKRMEVALRAISFSTKKHGSAPILPKGYQVVVHKDYTNSKGNITGNRARQIIDEMKMNGRGKQYFLVHPSFDKVGAGGMQPGIYVRRGKKLKIVLIFVKANTIRYEVGYPFYRRMEKIIKMKFGRIYRTELRKAFATARL